MKENNQRQDRYPTWKPQGCLFGLLVLAILIVILPIVIPLSAVAAWRVDYRLRRFYRRAHRLLCWRQASQFMSTSQGIFLFERHPKGIGGDVWWLEDKMTEINSSCPLTPARALNPSSEPSVNAWWDSHVHEFTQAVFYVEIPSKAWWRQTKMLSAQNAFVVPEHWTHTFREY